MDAGLNTYFVIYSKTSRYGVIGLKPQVTWLFEKDIINAATEELRRVGETLEGMAGIEWTEDDGIFRPVRELTSDETLALSTEKLADEGRLFDIFRTSADGAAEFIEAAEYYGLGDKARTLVEEFTSCRS
jgi:hypothetical protein